MKRETRNLTHAALRADPVGEPGRLRALHQRLVREAEPERLLDVAFRTLDSPLGTLLVAATRKGLVRVAFQGEDLEQVLEELADRVSPRVLRADARLDPVARALEAYFDGRRRRFQLPLDWQLAHGFRRTVLQQLARTVPYGQTVTYAQLAARAKNPRAVRAVGTTCATNPLPIVIPCHRVVRTDGGVGGYRGGPRNKQLLLALEGAQTRS